MNWTGEPGASPTPPPGPDMVASIASALQGHLEVCNDLLALAQKESDALSRPEPFPATALQADRKALLSRLESALTLLVRQRTLWQQSSIEGIARNPQLARLVQPALDTIMRVLVLDRENEQQFLRRGMLPARSLPPAEHARPNYVARLYLRHAQDRSR